MRTLNKTIIKFLLLILFFLGSYLFLRFTGVHHYLRPEILKNWVAAFGWWAPFIYMGLYAFLSLLLVPGTVLSISGGLLFGPYWGTLYTIIGAVVSAVLAYFIAKKLGRDFVANHLRGRFQELYLSSEKQGFKIVFLLRLIPLVPFDVINYAVGLSPIKFHHYLLATALGIAPATFAYNYLGSSLLDLHSPKFIVALGILGLFIFIPLLYWKRKQKNAGRKEN